VRRHYFCYLLIEWMVSLSLVVVLYRNEGSLLCGDQFRVFFHFGPTAGYAMLASLRLFRLPPHSFSLVPSVHSSSLLE
jgi:hypothetical protein